MGSKSEAGRVEVNVIRFHEFFSMPRIPGKGKGKIDMSKATSVSQHTASVLQRIITSFSHWVSDIQSLGLLPLPNTLLLTATNAPYLNSLYPPRGTKIFLDK